MGGGYNGAFLSSVSAYRPGQAACPLPSLPAVLWSPTLDSVAGLPTACGGNRNYTTARTCLQLEGSAWRQVATLQEERVGHYSWYLPEGLLLLGGRSTGGGHSRTTELVVATGDQQPGYRFSMDTERSEGCSIITEGGLVIIGGSVGDDWMWYSTRVTMFSAEGQSTELPGLRTARGYPGCGKVIIGQQEVRRTVTPCPCSPLPPGAGGGRRE